MKWSIKVEKRFSHSKYVGYGGGGDIGTKIRKWLSHTTLWYRTLIILELDFVFTGLFRSLVPNQSHKRRERWLRWDHYYTMGPLFLAFVTVAPLFSNDHPSVTIWLSFNPVQWWYFCSQLFVCDILSYIFQCGFKMPGKHLVAHNSAKLIAIYFTRKYVRYEWLWLGFQFWEIHRFSFISLISIT